MEDPPDVHGLTWTSGNSSRYNRCLKQKIPTKRMEISWCHIFLVPCWKSSGKKSLSKKLPAPSSVKGCDRPGLPRVASTFRGNQFGRENPGALLVGRSWHHLRWASMWMQELLRRNFHKKILSQDLIVSQRSFLKTALFFPDFKHQDVLWFLLVSTLFYCCCFPKALDHKSK